ETLHQLHELRGSACVQAEFVADHDFLFDHRDVPGRRHPVTLPASGRKPESAEYGGTERRRRAAPVCLDEWSRHTLSMQIPPRPPQAATSASSSSGLSG